MQKGSFHSESSLFAFLFGVSGSVRPMIAPSGIVSFNRMALHASLIERHQYYFLIALRPFGNTRKQPVACDTCFRFFTR